MSARIIKEYCPVCAQLTRTYTLGAGTDEDGILAALEAAGIGVVSYAGEDIPVEKRRGLEHDKCIPRTTESIAKWKREK